MNDYDWLIDSQSGNERILCRCVWSRTIGYDIAIITGGQINEHNSRIVGLSRTFYIEISHSVGEMKCRSAEHEFVGLKSHL